MNAWVNMNVDLIQETTLAPSMKSLGEKNLKGVAKTDILLTDTDTNTSIHQCRIQLCIF